MKGLNKKCYGLLLALFIIFGLSLSVSLEANAEQVSVHYDTANVDFYAGQQVQANVSLPWNANPGTHRFFLNNVYFNENSYNGDNLSYIAGRMVMDIQTGTFYDTYVCGVRTDYYGSSAAGATSNCLGSITIVYTDGTNTKNSDLPVNYNQTNAKFSIFFDYSTALESSKTVDFIQFRYYAKEGYDVFSKNVNHNNTVLMILLEGRGSINAYDTPPSGAEIANDLLQQQIGQNQTIIEQNQETYDYLTDDTPPTADTSVLGSSSGWLPAGPVDSILTLPVQLAQGIVNVFTNPGQCSPLSLPLPWVDYNLEVPCVGPLMDTIGFTPIWGIIGGIISAFIIYDTLKWLYKFVDDTLTLRENNSTMWGGL